MSSKSKTDFYQFTLTEPGVVTASLTGLRESASLTLVADINGNGVVAFSEKIESGIFLESGVFLEEYLGPGTYFFQVAEDAVWVVFPFVLGMSFILLMIVFRSIVVPIKAIILNLLSVAATYGLLVLMFQKGLGEDLGLFVQFDIIEAWIPLFLFTILFGLSMDYHVFLLSRIRERFDQTGDNTESVAFGIRSTGRLITGAALIMVAVFWAFAAGDLVGLQQMGFGLGIAILIDATIVRMVLVPASMKLLGERNWYLPSALSWLPDFRVESESTISGGVTIVEPAGDD